MRTYRINEIFYSIQGEGEYTGRAAVFIRFSGCNLKCPFCDTDFKDFVEGTAEQIVERVKEVGGDCRFVVLTGGEPTLQADIHLCDMLHEAGYYIAMETNGTKPVMLPVDWVTVSPKQPFVGTVGTPSIRKANEVKVVFDGVNTPSTFGIEAEHYYLQPCDTGDKAKNDAILQTCLRYILKQPKWKLSLQTQKIINVR